MGSANEISAAAGAGEAAHDGNRSNGAPAPKVACRADYNAVVPTRRGRFLVNRNDEFVGRSLIELGSYSEPELEALLALLRPGDFVVDAGANIGAFTVPFGAAVGDNGRVLAFEPQNKVFHLLAANVALNSLQHRVEPLNLALGQAAANVPFPDPDPRRLTNFGGVPCGPAAGARPTAMLPLDAFGLKSLRLLKIDVEGMEPQVLIGAARTIEACRPIIHAEVDRVEAGEETVRILCQMGYRVYDHITPLGDLWPGIGSINCIAYPSEVEQPNLREL